ncbi:zinc transporter ZntB [Teredinibacter sp. KSP-S5-2]|uniref:zinc transporter ZntB n=1 Tax=Teredinibacter sp. KSP-S5-2 TaxID=3034506 RepID=UPI002934DA95|nr:zinc transporter ZntB [Teredinibacter sp. KSP-S5-2]WNO11412.1 zinc transporter ZntB [Teredinibacter sp. KSP-S5-2]
MENTTPAIFIKVLDKKGGCIEYSDLHEAKQSKQPLWVHINGNHPNAMESFREAAEGIDEHSLAALFDENVRPRALELEKGMLVILRGINHNKNAQPEDMISVRIWITPNSIVSMRYRRSRAVMSVAERLDVGSGPTSIPDLLVSVISTLLSYTEVIIEQIQEQLDHLEDQILDHPNKKMRKDISNVLRKAIMLRRYIAPQHDAVNIIRYVDALTPHKKSQRRMHESLDNLLRDIEDLDSIRERAHVVKDELASSLSDKLNRNLYLLSVITAIFLPLGFLTGLFGVNVGGMPGVGEPQAFTVFSLILFALVAIQIILFRVFKWF